MDDANANAAAAGATVTGAVGEAPPQVEETPEQRETRLRTENKTNAGNLLVLAMQAVQNTFEKVEIEPAKLIQLCEAYQAMDSMVGVDGQVMRARDQSVEIRSLRDELQRVSTERDTLRHDVSQAHERGKAEGASEVRSQLDDVRAELRMLEKQTGQKVATTAAPSSQ